MKKVVIYRPGAYERLCIERYADLVPGPDEVLVEAEAIGINYADCVTRMGLYASAKRYVGFPITQDSRWRVTSLQWVRVFLILAQAPTSSR